MKILVTGGAGFIGSNLCERLNELGHDVVSLDNYFTGSRDNHVPGVQYIYGSTVDIFQKVHFKPDLIYHLGEYSRVEQSFLDIEQVLEFNKNGTSKVLEFARVNDSKLIYAGSSTKFGDSGTNASESPYAWSKSSNTELVKNYGKWFNLKYAIAYFYNVYGKNEIKTGPYSTLIALFAEKLRKSEKFGVVSPGTQRRNFTHVNDTVNALVLIGEHGDGDEYGIGDDKSYSIIEIAEMFGSDYEMLPERKGNRMSAPVITERTKRLGWCAEYNLKDYIENLKKEMK
jgi:UDP-glucose 4-epimerase